MAAIGGKKQLGSSLESGKAHTHPNRVLFYDDALTVLLLAFFNPVMRSLRMIEDFSKCPLVQDGARRWTCICKSTLSDLQRSSIPRCWSR